VQHECRAEQPDGLPKRQFVDHTRATAASVREDSGIS
jgi:hypothetical protein